MFVDNLPSTSTIITERSNTMLQITIQSDEPVSLTDIKAKVIQGVSDYLDKHYDESVSMEIDANMYVVSINV